MTTKEKSYRNKRFIRQSIELLLVMVFVGYFVVYVIPIVKHWLFPDQMDRLENLLRRSVFRECALKVERRDEFTIFITLERNSAPHITTEIYKGVVREIEPIDENRTFFAHSINRNDNKVFYLTRTLIEADTDLEKIRRLEISFCGRIKDQTGNVRYKDHEPIYECEVPELKAVCLCTDDQ
ncbi:MAG: hypothetical protein PVH87_11515 [Desulfobacteraceae bacterium]|jgi:hypothetical protein